MWLENKYIGLVSVRLDKFKRKNNGYNFRCPFCGDSQHSKTKARGWIYQEKGVYRYHCFNCDYHTSFPKFLKNVDYTLYTQYKVESLGDTKTKEQEEYEKFVEKITPKPYIKGGPLKGLKKISQLKVNDPLKEYIVNRRIPNPYHAKLFKCDNFMSWVNTIVPNKFDESALRHDETRLLIPFINKENVVHAVQGRSLKAKSEVKYITIILDDNVPKVWGLDDADLNKRTYVFEGPIDAMFVPNSISTAGGDLVSTLRNFKKDNIVIVYDNEPRSKETRNKIDKAIMNGYNVCIWPDNFSHKDVNDMIMADLSSDFVKWIIDQNTYRDLAAKLRLTQWSKV